MVYEKKYILEKSEFFNMKKICELANVNYSTFRGWKNQDRPLSIEKLKSISFAMNKAHLNEHEQINKITLRDLTSVIKIEGITKVYYQLEDGLHYELGYGEEKTEWYVDKEKLLNSEVVKILSHNNINAAYDHLNYIIIYVK